MNDSYLQVIDVTKNFGDFTALQNVSLDVKKGEFVCFLGPSGCGKTTLLRAIAGLDIQSSGAIIQGDTDISDLPPSERDFGIVFQSYALFPNLSVANNVGFGLIGSGKSKSEIKTKVKGLLEQVGLPDQAKKYPSQLSGGQQQRVALARALATEPNLLLLDEPLSALDAKVRVHLRRQLKELQQTLGLTTIMVTHDQDEALNLADRIVVLSQGRIEQVGTPIEVYSQPANAFVADFVGEMNFIEAKRVDSGHIGIGDIHLAADMQAVDGAEQLIAAIRPEDIQVQNADTAPNGFSATVTDLEFCGSYLRATMRDARLGGAEFRADLSMNLARRLQVKEGGALAIAMPPEHLRVYPAK
ncbi:MAG: putative 2-aminoethylphosphonate ABC transporter ATP-binding protein [Mangrovicoccus sp.]|nr:putative 2-aminoethylphosphonate ABC transporter ATP-binding protein [Mangrovicoccus sp.]